MKKKALTAGIMLCLIIISIYFSTPSPIVKNPDNVQIHWVSVVNSKYKTEDITSQIDRNQLVQTIGCYSRSRIPYRFAPYQVAVGDIDIGYFDNGRLKHISLGKVNVVYESADKGGYKIYNNSKLINEINKMVITSFSPSADSLNN